MKGGTTREHHAECERYQRQVGGNWIAYVEDKAVGEDGEEWREAFDRVDEGDRYFGRGSGGEKMPAYLEGCQGKGGYYDFTGGRSDAMAKRRNVVLEEREHGRKPGEEHTV